MRLSNQFKIPETFQKEFDEIFTASKHERFHTLTYITNCAQIVFDRARIEYPNHSLHYINPVFIYKNKIYESADLENKDTHINMVNIYNALRATFDLIESGTILPIAKIVVEKELNGLCLFHGNIDKNYTFKSFKTFNLDTIDSEIKMLKNRLHLNFLIDTIKESDDNISNYSNSFANELKILSEADKLKFAKTLLLYNLCSNVIDRTLSISYVNKYNKTNSLFDCIFTLISEKPFSEEELLDFAIIVESISFPIANYYQKNKELELFDIIEDNADFFEPLQ